MILCKFLFFDIICQWKKTIIYLSHGVYWNLLHSCSVLDLLSGNSLCGFAIFYHCFSLADIEIPDSVETIGSYAFYQCGSLENVTIPGSVQTIGSGAFTDCEGLKNVTISSGVKKIDTSAFSRCNHLKTLSLLLRAFCRCFLELYWSLRCGRSSCTDELAATKELCLLKSGCAQAQSLFCNQEKGGPRRTYEAVLQGTFPYKQWFWMKMNRCKNLQKISHTLF